MSLAKRLLTNIFWLFVSEVCTKGVTLITSLYLARVLGVAGFGKYSLALAVGTYLAILVDMGVVSYGVREIAKNREQAASLMNIMNSMRLLLALSVLLVMTAILPFTGVQAETKMILIFGGWYVISSALSCDWVFQGLERMQYLALTNATIAAVFLAGIVLFVKAPEDALSAIVYRSVSFLAGSILSLYVLNRMLKIRFSFHVSLKAWWFHIRESFYFAVNNALNSMALYIPIFFLGAVGTIEQVGLFSAPQKLVLALTAAPTLIASGSYPIMSSLFVTDREKFHRVHGSFERGMLFIGMPVGVIGTMLNTKIVQTFFGSSYASSSLILGVLAWLTPLMFLRTNYGRSLASAGYHRLNMIAAACGSFVSGLLCLVLIRLYAGTGAAVAVVAGETVTLLAMWVLFRANIYPANPFNGYFFKVLCAGAGTGVLLHFLGRASLVSSVMAGSLCYALLAFIIGVYDSTTVKDLYHRLGGRLGLSSLV